MTYDPRKDGAESYNEAIKAIRMQKIRSGEINPIVTVSFPVAELFGHANGKSFWRKSKPTKAAREEAHKAVIAAGLHKWPHDSAALKLRIVRPHRKHDPHNIPGATKAIIDGVADGLGINDKKINVIWEIAEEIDKLLETDTRTKERLEEARADAFPF